MHAHFDTACCSMVSVSHLVSQHSKHLDRGKPLLLEWFFSRALHLVKALAETGSLL